MFDPDAAICDYRQVSNIRHTLVGNSIVDHSDVVGAVPRGDAPTTSEWSTIELPTNVPLGTAPTTS